MPIYHAIQGATVSGEELWEKAPAISIFASAVEKRNTEAVLHLSSGVVEAKPLVDRLRREAIGEFTPIGLNKPLTVQIRHVYTGQFPNKSVFSNAKDLLLTSAFKNAEVFNAAPRAVNFLRKKVTTSSNFNSPAASEDGTPIVSYSAAVTSSSTILTLEMVFDQFPDELFGKLSTTFSALAGIPVFIPASGYLLTASTIVKLVGDLGHALFDGRPVFSATETLDFDVPGSTLPLADFRIVCGSDLDPTPLRFEPGKGLVDRQSGHPYEGSSPYVVLSLDGKKRDEYATFAPTAASAALLDRFYTIKDGAEAVMDTLVSAVKLYSDSKYRAQADAVRQKIQGLDPNSPEAKALNERYQALLENILNDVMKPKS